jgi:predicted phosphodiesterase
LGAAVRIAVISDIHGNALALEAVLEDISGVGADVVVNLGDILSGPLEPVRTADILMALDLPTISGNHERQVLTLPEDRIGKTDAFTRGVLEARHLAWLRSLPRTLRLSAEVVLCHGTPDSDVEYFLEDVTAGGIDRATPEVIERRAGNVEAELILCGHTHLPGVIRLGDGRIVANPGSVGLQAYEDDKPFPHVVETGSPHGRYMLAERHGGRWSFRQMHVAYDWDAAAALARENGREDWAIALATGRAGRS